MDILIKRNLIVILTILVFTHLSCKDYQSVKTKLEVNKIDIDLAKIEIIINLSLISEYFKKGDSLAIVQQYAENGTFGSAKTKEELLSTWNGMIKSGIENGTPNLIFKTNSISTDGEFITELGLYKLKDNQGNVKYHGKYVTVWKQEKGKWKIYRDVLL